MDPLDWKLVNLLGHDARRLEVAASELGCSMQEITERLDGLVERGVVREVSARVAPESVGLPVTAFYLVRVAQNADTYDAIEQLIRDIDQVEEAHAVSGQFDWLVKVRVESVRGLQDLLTEQLALLPGFVRAETLVVLSTACDHVNVHAALHPLER